MNSNYRRHVWNDFVREYYKCDECCEKFNPIEFRKKYFNEIEQPNDIYKTFTVDISTEVTKDIIAALKIINHNNGRLKIKKFDRFRCSFKAPSRSRFVPQKNKADKLNSRIYLINDKQIRFRVRSGEFININLKEPLFYNTDYINGILYYFTKHDHFKFSNYDIKEISFIHELGKFYIQLSVEVENLYSKKKEITKRKNIAGIDLGIHNPVYVVDDDLNYVERMSNKELSRIKYLEKRIKRLQTILDRKTYGSKNYYKVLRKIRVSHYKIRNIRLNWRRKLAKEIATRYKKICVDRYNIPGDDVHVDLPYKLTSNFNTYNRLHGMYLFSESLIHACYKFKTKYYDSPKYTTRTCAKCKHVNNKLLLSTRELICVNCGLKIDRDKNAAINCFEFLLNKEIL